MAEALFKAVFVSVFLLVSMYLIQGKFLGWLVPIGCFIGTLTTELLSKKLRRS